MVTGVFWGQCEIDEATGEPLEKLNWESVRFCRELGSQASTVSEIVELQDPLVYNAIQKGIDAVNQEATSNAQKIQKWIILEKDFSIYGGELGERPGEPWAWLLGHVGLEMCPLLGSEGLWDQLGTHKGMLAPLSHWCPAPPFSPGQPHPSLCE